MTDKPTEKQTATWKMLADANIDYTTNFTSVLAYATSAHAALQGTLAEIERLQKELADANGATARARDAHDQEIAREIRAGMRDAPVFGSYPDERD